VLIEYVGSRPKGVSFKCGHIIIVIHTYWFTFSLEEYWRVNALSRVAFFVWMAALEKILTLDNMRKRHVIMVDWCHMWKKSEESIDHFLFHCEVVGELCCSLFNHLVLFELCLEG
jgi:hypothetical protein